MEKEKITTKDIFSWKAAKYNKIFLKDNFLKPAYYWPHADNLEN